MITPHSSRTVWLADVVARMILSHVALIDERDTTAVQACVDGCGFYYVDWSMHNSLFSRTTGYTKTNRQSHSRIVVLVLLPTVPNCLFWAGSSLLTISRRKLEKALVGRNLRQAASGTARAVGSRDVIENVIIRFAVCHLLLVVHWNRTSISNYFRDIRSQHMLTNTPTNEQTNE